MVCRLGVLAELRYCGCEPGGVEAREPPLGHGRPGDRSGVTSLVLVCERDEVFARRSEAAVAKAGIKMLFPIVLFILPALFVITLVPGVLTVLHDLKQGFGPPH